MVERLLYTQNVNGSKPLLLKRFLVLNWLKCNLDKINISVRFTEELRINNRELAEWLKAVNLSFT